MKVNNIVPEDILYEDVELPRSAFGMGQYNNSHYFLLPLFRLRGMLAFSNEYIGSYIDDSGRICNIDDRIHIVFKFENFTTSKYQRVNSYFEERKDYKFSYYAGSNNGNLVCYVLKADKEDSDCYKSIVNGEYSKVPNWYIDRASNFPFSIDVRKRLQGICRKEEWHRNEIEALLDVDLGNVEQWSAFEPHMEIFRYNVKKKEETIQL